MMRFQPQLDWIDLQRRRMEELVSAWSDINSGSHHRAGLERCAARIVAAFGALGGELRLIDLPPAERVDERGNIARRPLGRAIHIVKRPDAPVKVLLAIHYDTVFGEEHPFQSATRLDANTLRGPGVADAKGGIIVLLTALAALERSDAAERLGWEVLLTPDEEIGSPGSGRLFVEAAARNQVGLVFEPSLPDGALVGSRKGSGNFVAVIRGRAAHAGRDPERGRNAIHALAEVIISLTQITARVPGATLNVGKIEGGGPVNIVPDLAIARFNLRMDTREQHRVIQQSLDEIAAGINRREGLAMELQGGFTAPPKPLDDPMLALLEQIGRCGGELGMRISHRPAGGVCDGNRLAAAGLPTVDSLGPRGGDLHSDSEFVLLDSLPERAKLIALLLLKYASGEMVPPAKAMLSSAP